MGEAGTADPLKSATSREHETQAEGQQKSGGRFGDGGDPGFGLSRGISTKADDRRAVFGNTVCKAQLPTRRHEAELSRQEALKVPGSVLRVPDK